MAQMLPPVARLFEKVQQAEARHVAEIDALTAAHSAALAQLISEASGGLPADRNDGDDAAPAPLHEKGTSSQAVEAFAGNSGASGASAAQAMQAPSTAGAAAPSSPAAADQHQQEGGKGKRQPAKRAAGPASKRAKAAHAAALGNSSGTSDVPPEARTSPVPKPCAKTKARGQAKPAAPAARLTRAAKAHMQAAAADTATVEGLQQHAVSPTAEQQRLAISPAVIPEGVARHEEPQAAGDLPSAAAPKSQSEASLHEVDGDQPLIAAADVGAEPVTEQLAEPTTEQPKQPAARALRAQAAESRKKALEAKKASKSMAAGTAPARGKKASAAAPTQRACAASARAGQPEPAPQELGGTAADAGHANSPHEPALDLPVGHEAAAAEDIAPPNDGCEAEAPGGAPADGHAVAVPSSAAMLEELPLGQQLPPQQERAAPGARLRTGAAGTPPTLRVSTTSPLLYSPLPETPHDGSSSDAEEAPAARPGTGAPAAHAGGGRGVVDTAGIGGGGASIEAPEQARMDLPAAAAAAELLPAEAEAAPVHAPAPDASRPAPGASLPAAEHSPPRAPHACAKSPMCGSTAAAAVVPSPSPRRAAQSPPPATTHAPAPAPAQTADPPPAAAPSSHAAAMDKSPLMCSPMLPSPVGPLALLAKAFDATPSPADAAAAAGVAAGAAAGPTPQAAAISPSPRRSARLTPGKPSVAAASPPRPAPEPGADEFGGFSGFATRMESPFAGLAPCGDPGAAAASRSGACQHAGDAAGGRHIGDFAFPCVVALPAAGTPRGRADTPDMPSKQPAGPGDQQPAGPGDGGAAVGINAFGSPCGALATEAAGVRGPAALQQSAAEGPANCARTAARGEAQLAAPDAAEAEQCGAAPGMSGPARGAAASPPHGKVMATNAPALSQCAGDAQLLSMSTANASDPTAGDGPSHVGASAAPPSTVAAMPARPAGSNLVASVRSFLPAKRGASPPPPAAGTKKPPVRALEAAQVARRADEARARAKDEMKHAAKQGGVQRGARHHAPRAGDGKGPATASDPKTTHTAGGVDLNRGLAVDSDKAAIGLASPVGTVKAKAAVLQQRILQDAEARKAEVERRQEAARSLKTGGLASHASAPAAKPMRAVPASSNVRAAPFGATSSGTGAHDKARAAAASQPAHAASLAPTHHATRPDVNEKLRRAEQRRKDEEERRKAELEARQRLKDQRAKALRQPAPGGTATGPPARPTPLKPRNANVTGTQGAGVPAQGMPGKARGATAAGLGKPGPTTGGGMLTPVAGTAGTATASAAATTTHQQPMTPAELAVEAHNIQMLISSPYVNPGVHRTPRLGTVTKPTNQVLSYEISPYRSDSDEDDEWLPDPKKTVPEWAKPAALLPALQAQARLDPDKIFCTKMKTCSLEQIFEGMPPPQPPADPAKARKWRDWRGRRGSSGNWIKDRLTWQEETEYKKAMGFS